MSIQVGDRVAVYQQIPPFSPYSSQKKSRQWINNPWAFPLNPQHGKMRCWGDWAIVVLRRQRKGNEFWLIVTSDHFPEPLRSQGVRVPLTHVELIERGYGLPAGQSEEQA